MRLYGYAFWHRYWHRLLCVFRPHAWQKGAILAYMSPPGRIWFCSKCGAMAEGDYDRPVPYVVNSALILPLSHEYKSHLDRVEKGTK